jgi:hypothetical protein
MKIKELGTITVNEVIFRKADNGQQIFYDHKSNEIYWCVLRNHIANGEDRVLCWFAFAEDKKGALMPLNTATFWADGTQEKDPLYDATDLGSNDPPVRLLTAMADLIRRKVGPWTLQGAQP